MDLRNRYRGIQDKYDSGMTLDDFFSSPDKTDDVKIVTPEEIGEMVVTDEKGREVKDESPTHIKSVSRTDGDKLVQLRPRSFKFSQSKAISSIAEKYGITNPVKDLKKLLKYDPYVHGSDKDAFISEVSEILVKVQNDEWDAHLASLPDNQYDSTILATIEDARKIVEELNKDERLITSRKRDEKPLLSNYEPNKAGELLYKIDLLKWAQKNVIKVEEITDDEEDDIKSVDSDVIKDVINAVPELSEDLTPLVETNDVDKVKEVFDDAVNNFINYLQSQYDLIRGMRSVRTSPDSDASRKFKEEYVKNAEEKEHENTLQGKVESLKSKIEDAYSKKYEKYQDELNSKIDDAKIELAESKLNEPSSGIGKVTSKIKQDMLKKRIERLESYTDSNPFTGFFNTVSNAWNKGRDALSKFDAQVTKWIAVAWLAIIGIKSVVEIVPHIGDMILGLFGFGGKRISGLTDEESEMSVDEFSEHAESQSVTGRTAEQISSNIQTSIESDADYQKEIKSIEEEYSETAGTRKWYGGKRTDKELAKWRLEKSNKVFRKIGNETAVQPENQLPDETDEEYSVRALNAFNEAKQIKLSQSYKSAEDRAKSKIKREEEVARKEVERTQNAVSSASDSQNLLRSEHSDTLGDKYYFMEYDTKVRRYIQNHPDSKDADIIRDVFNNDSDLYRRYKNSAKFYEGKSSVSLGTSVDKDGKRVYDTYDLTTGSIVRYDYEGDKQGSELSRMEIKNEDDISEITRSIGNSGDEVVTTTSVSSAGATTTTTRIARQNILTKGSLQTENNQLVYTTQINYENPETGAAN